MSMPNMPRPPKTKEKLPAPFEVVEERAEDDTFDPKSFLPAGDPESWDWQEWQAFEEVLDNMEPKYAVLVENEAWARLGMSSSGDVVAAAVKKVTEPKCVCEAKRFAGKHTGQCPVFKATATTVTRNIGAERLLCNSKCNFEEYSNFHLVDCPASTLSGALTTVHQNAVIKNKVTYVKYKCAHARSPFALENGLSVFLSAWRDIEFVQDKQVNIGIYLYNGWMNKDLVVTPGLKLPWAKKRVTQAVYLDWPDCGPPGKELAELMPKLVQWVLDLMAKGTAFEVGCLGAHGRTGTFAACLLAAQGLSPGEAISRVRNKHCKDAIERQSQCTYVAEFYKLYHGHEDWTKERRLRRLFNKLRNGTTKGYQSKNSSTSITDYW